MAEADAEAGGLRVVLLGIGIVAPGLTDWPQARAVLRGDAPYTRATTVVPPPQRLPATERRRAGTIIKVSIVAADEALAMSGLDAADVATVFSASEGDGRNCHDLCDALASSDRMVSPTRFTNSVHNAPAGYWHIATHSMAPSTSLCAHDASFATGLMETALQVQASQAPVLLVVADAPYPEPLHSTRPLPDSMAIAMLLGPWLAADGDANHQGLATLTLDYRSAAADATASSCDLAEMQSLTRALPAARGLPLLQAIARGTAGDFTASDFTATNTCAIDCFDDLTLHISVVHAHAKPTA